MKSEINVLIVYSTGGKCMYSEKKTIQLSGVQIEFILKAIYLKDEVFAFKHLDDNIFEQSYGLKKEELLNEINELEELLNQKK